METYPKIVTLDEPKLVKLLTEKGDIIKTGIKESEQIEAYEKEMEELDKQIQEEEAKVDVADLVEEEAAITKTVEEAIQKMEAIKQRIFARMKENVNHELVAKYEDIKKKKEDAEENRNKLALKAQKFNDKIIPLARKALAQFLTDAYDDYETIRLEEGKIVATIFNHMEEWKTRFNARKNK